ncbi:multifunctional expression regulator [Mandrillus leucophaeus cytomegalovirus]|uniref:mRNA export factor ICP27 homolog n=1 Tax=Mandrillus leucophaeus cytomegalovirus TaxID=1654930 RepID=A0A0G2UPE6_9BETA|nr:multifunctional expression regulator [Mandrillus leucophaeus cytomegalovirus]AKI29776.1 multifunctional expression regulator [Mandrillus leucophaeus cytomegalovirus]
MSLERKERAHFRESPASKQRSLTANDEDRRHTRPAHPHIYSVTETQNLEHANHPRYGMDLHQGYRNGPALSQLSDRERRARRVRRFCLDGEDEPPCSFKRARYEQRPQTRRPSPATPAVRDSPESPPPGPDSGRRPTRSRHHHTTVSRHETAVRQPLHCHGAVGGSNRSHGEHVTVSPATSSNRQMLAIINHELDTMDDVQLQHLSRMIEKKKEERQKLGKSGEVRDDASQPSSTSPVYDLQRYTAEALHLTPYPDDLKKPTAFPQDTKQPGRLLISHEELMNTDYLLNIRQQFDWLSPSLLRRLVVERTFAVFNAPSLHMLLAMTEETLSYIKFHFLHSLPINPYDPYMATVSGLRQLLFNKLNNLDLPCIMDGGTEWSHNCHILKALIKKPVKLADDWQRDDALDLQKQPPESFTNPVHRAVAYVCSFSRAVAALRRRSRQIPNTPHFLDQYDDNGAMESYRCGMVSELILQILHQHQCQNEICELRIQKGLNAYRFMLAYCPFDTKCFLDITTFAASHENASLQTITPLPSPAVPMAPATTTTVPVSTEPPHSSSYTEPAPAPSHYTSGISPLNRNRTVSEAQNSGSQEPVVLQQPPAETEAQMSETADDTATAADMLSDLTGFLGHEVDFAPAHELPQPRLTWSQLPSPPPSGTPETGTVICSQPHVQPAVVEPDWMAAISALSTLPDSALSTQRQQPPTFELFTDSMSLRCQTPECEEMCYSDVDEDDENDEGY